MPKIVWPEAHVEMGEHRLNFDANTPLGPDLEEKAFKELRETPEIRETSIEQLRNMIKEKGEIELGLDDEKLFLAFLRVCKFYPESAYNRMLHYYKFCGQHPKIFDNLCPTNDSKALKNDVFNILPKRDKEGRRVLMVQAGHNWNVKEVSLNDLIRCIMLLIMGGVVEDATQVAGAIVIIDLKGMTITHAWQFSPATAKILLEYIQECVPCRLKAIHIVNHPYVFNMIFSIFKPFMNEKLRNRIYFHSGEKTGLRESVGAKSLPSQYGGEMNFDLAYGEQTWELLCKFEEFYKLALQNKYVPPSKKK